MQPIEFGYQLGLAVEKQASGVGRGAANAGTALGGAFKAAPAKPVGTASVRGGMMLPDGQKALPAWLRQGKAMQAGLDPATGSKPGAVAPAPPPPTPVPGAAAPMTAPTAAARPRGFEASGWFK